MTPVPAPNDKAYKLTCRGNELYERRLYAEAIQEYSRVITDSASIGADNDFLALLYSNRSACYLLMKRYIDARDDASQVIQLSPGWAKGYFRLGEAYMKLQQYDDAIKCYKDALERDPDNAEISSRVARALLEKDNQTMGLSIIQLMAGRDIATERHFRNPIQNRIYEFARVMRNIIYIVADDKTKRCVLVDAARQCWDIDGILRIVDELGYNVVATAISHHHFDHVGGSPPAPYDTLPIKIPGLATLLKKLPHIKAYVHPDDIEYIRQANPSIPANKLVSTCTEVTEVLEIGKTRLRFLPTPGHTPGSQSILVNDCRLLAGDTLLCGFCGRTDLPGGDKKVMEKTLRQTLGALDDRVVVYPGHHYGSEWSTIGIERDKGCLGEDLVGFGSSFVPSSPSAASLAPSRKLTRSLSRKRNK